MIGAITRWLGAAAGWRVVGHLPDLPKYMLIGAPHTTNWDFVLFLWVMAALRFQPTWLGKDGIFWWPAGVLWRRLGGIPVKRGARLNVVDQVVDRFREADRMTLVMSPEGTRQHTTAWKSGFYHIARGAGVPIVPGRLDYPTRTVTIGGPIAMTGDVSRDMAEFRAFYAGARGMYPARASDIALSAGEGSEGSPARSSRDERA